MKKILFFIGAVLLFTVSCTKFPEETQIDFKEGPKVEITIVTASNPDSTICFKLKTSNEAAYISYLIEEAIEKDTSKIPSNILKCTYDGIKKGTLKYDEQPNGEAIIEVTNLKPFTVYQIYAVTSHKDGGVGVLSNANTKTTDNIPPRYVSRSISERTITLTFSEPVQRGNGRIFATYYSQTPFAAMVDSLMIEEENVSISENYMNIYLFDEFPTGSHICITWEENMVKDLYGNPVSKFTTKGYIPGQGSGAGWQGCYVRLPFEKWDFEGIKDLEEFTDLSTFRIILTLGTPTPPVSRVNSNFDNSYVVYKSSGRELKFNLPRNNAVVTSDGKLSITLPLTDMLVKGALISLVIQEGSYIDKYANACNFFEIEDMYKYVGP